MEELQKDEQFRQLAATAAVISEMDILVCDMDGHVLLSTDATMEGRPVTIPSSVMDKVSADGTWAGRSRLDQIYSSKQFVGGVSVVNPTTGEVLGAVFTVCASDSVDNLWRAFAGLLMMTGFVVLMISFMASSITTMRQIKPIREMAAATRQYADGDFDVRMNDYGREDEIGELAASFNNMAESLQQTERQRREFIANISHELKTPLASIKLLTDSILQNNMDMDTVKEFVADIGNEADRLNRMTAKLLSLTRAETPQPQESEIIYMAPTVQRVAKMLRTNASWSGVTFCLELDEDTPVLILEDDLYQIVFNLMENGIKYNLPGGTLTVHLGRQEDNAVLTVSDTGMGIPEDALEHIFERFYRVDKSHSKEIGGTGLGLSIVKHAALILGAAIELDSTVGKGTIVMVRFPMEKK